MPATKSLPVLRKHTPLDSSFPVYVPYAPELYFSEHAFDHYIRSLPCVREERIAPADSNIAQNDSSATGNTLIDAMSQGEARLRTSDQLAADGLTLTENGDVAYLSTKSALVDLFYELKQGIDQNNLVKNLDAAWQQDPLLTLKIIFNCRSIHLGKGARDTAYMAFGWLYRYHPKTFLGNVRWLTRPIIEKKMVKKDETSNDETFEAVCNEEPAQLELEGDEEDTIMVDLDTGENFDVKNGTSHGYWKDLLNLLVLIVTEQAYEPRTIFNIAKPQSKKRKDRDWSAEHAKDRKKEQRRRNSARLASHFTERPQYKALHLLVARLFATQLRRDLKLLKAGRVRQISLAAKWAPSAKEMHDRHTFIVSTIAEALFPPTSENLSTATLRTQYLKEARENYRRVFISPLRKALMVVERDITEEAFANIRYDRVPSLAMNRYQQLFLRKDVEGFGRYVEKVANGRAKISGAILLPSTLVAKVSDIYRPGQSYRGKLSRGIDAAATLDTLATARILDGQWNTIVQRIKDSGSLQSAIAVCDVSGSMYSPRLSDDTYPMDSSIGLSLLLAEVVDGAFGGHFISFSARPQLLKVGGSADKRSFTEKVQYIRQADIGYNTDFVAVFRDLILATAVAHKIPKEDMVKQVFAFSDMQFDHATLGESRWTSSFERIKEEYEKAGYEMPQLIFWNLAGHTTGGKPVDDCTEPGVGLVSGYNQAMLKIFLDNGTFQDEDEDDVIIEDMDLEGTGANSGDTEALSDVVDVKLEKQRKMNPLSVVRKAVSHNSYAMLKVLD